MIEIDYNLEQLGSSRSFKIDDELAKELKRGHRRFTLIGPNGKGKTFIMNLLAYSLFQESRDDDWFIPTIRSKIASLGNEEIYELGYEISIRVSEEKALVLSKKPGHQRLAQIDTGGNLSSPISPASVNADIDVVYDIPVDINKRLEHVIKSSEQEIIYLQDRVELTIRRVNSILTKASDVKDNEKVSRLKRRIEDLDKLELVPLRSQAMMLAKIRGDLLLIAELKRYIDKNKEVERVLADIEKLNRQLKGKTRPKGSEDNSDVTGKLVKDRVNELKLFSRHRDSFYDLLNRHAKVQNRLMHYDRGEFEVLEKYSKPLEGYTEDDVSRAIELIQENLDRTLVDFSNDDKSKFANAVSVIKSTLEVINKSESADGISIIFGKPIEDIILALDREIEGYDVTNYNIVIKSAKRTLDEAKKVIKNIFRIDVSIARERARLTLTESDKKLLLKFDQRAALKKDLPRLEKEIMSFRVSLESRLEETSILDALPKVESFYRSMTEREGVRDYMVHGISAVDKLSKEKARIELSITQVEEKRNEYVLQLRREESKPEAPFSNEALFKLEEIRTKLNTALIEIKNWRNDLHNYMQNGKILKPTDSTYRLMDALGKTIAKSFKYELLLDDGRMVKIANYNLLEKCFETGDKNVFYSLEYLSTGLSSSNYLRQKLGRAVKPNVIVLLDEIGDMDDVSLFHVKQEIKRIDEEGRLLLCLMSKPSNDKRISVKEF